MGKLSSNIRSQRAKNIIPQSLHWWSNLELRDFVKVYVGGLFQNQIMRTAASISWSFFISLFPFLLFTLSVLPYLPHYEDFKFYILNIFLAKILPSHILPDVSAYLENFLLPNIERISSWTLALALLFGTNGMFSLINGFNVHTGLKRPFLKEFSFALFLSTMFIVLIILMLFGIYYSEVVIKLYKPLHELDWFATNLSKIIGFLSFPVVYFLLLSILYWIGCLKMVRWVEAVPGAIFTTILFILLTYGFAVYVSNFASYNVLYGSVGTILLFMIWTNVNIVLILLGNELNIAIKNRRLNRIWHSQEDDLNLDSADL